MARILVAGAGPAGSCAAYHLARRGHQVVLVDKETFPRDKTCGDWIPRGALHCAQRMGIDLEMLCADPATHARVEATRLHAPNGRFSHVESREPSLCIPRRVFDARLRQRALAAGAQPAVLRLEAGPLQVGGTGGIEIDGPFDYAIDARGVYAGEANTIALRHYYKVSTGSLHALERTTIQLFTLRSIEMGYGWVFPVGEWAGETLFNVGVGISKTEYDAANSSIHECFQSFVAEVELVRRLRARSTAPSSGRGHHLALATRPRQVSRDGTFLVGDAANLTDPITGEGIANAMRSGELVTEALDRPEPALAWQSSYERAFVPEFQSALRLRGWLKTPRRRNMALLVMQLIPGLARRFHDGIEGVGSYRNVLPAPLLSRSAEDPDIPSPEPTREAT